LFIANLILQTQLLTQMYQELLVLLIASKALVGQLLLLTLQMEQLLIPTLAILQTLH